MIIKGLWLKDFRNYEQVTFVPGAGVNILHGRNAQGKTNLLEAILVAGTTRSHKNAKDRDMIRCGCEESHLRMDVERNDIERRIDLHLKKNAPKGIAIDQIARKRAGELLELSNMVFFSPEDLGIVKNGPSARRRFLNMELCQIDPLYMRGLASYQKILLQRAQLLREVDKDPLRIGELEPWDLQLIAVGEKLIAARAAFVRDLGGIAKEKHAYLTDGQEEMDLRYEPSVAAQEFAVALSESRDRDIRYHETHVGPHRDDVAILSNGMDMRTFGSQGQQRTCALSLKLSEIALLAEKKKDMPVLLLDDVLSELDRDRQEKLLSGIGEMQTFLTCTGMDEVIGRYFAKADIFHVDGGMIEAMA